MTNPDLLQAFAPLRRELRNPTAPFDPWWWPIGSGHGIAEWGLAPEDSGLLPRLRGSKPTNSSYAGFSGSLGAERGAAVLVSTRPSEGSFPSASCTRLHSSLVAAGIAGAHVTDMMKFRGPNDERAASWEMWQVSFDCLLAEFDAIEPSVVVIVPEAKKWVTAWLNGGFGRWGNRLPSNQVRLLQWLDRHAGTVPFWGGQSRKGTMTLQENWAEGLAEAKRISRKWTPRGRSA